MLAEVVKLVEHLGNVKYIYLTHDSQTFSHLHGILVPTQ